MQDNSYLNLVKSTIIRNGRLAMNTERFFSATVGRDGLNVMAIEHVAARLAGGMLEMIDMVTLRQSVSRVLPETDMGELQKIRDLPGMAKAAASSLMKFWMSGIDPETVKHKPRMQALFALEEAVLRDLPANLRRPVDLRDLALKRAHLASRIFGQIWIKGMTDLHPVWRSLILAIADQADPTRPVIWDAGPRAIPDWLGDKVFISTSSETIPEINAVTCANARHEVVEAVRWVRNLMISGKDASEIAIATTNTASYDDIFTAVAAEADIKLHFVHGISSVHTEEGQACAALADILLRGLSQKRVRRLIELVGTNVPCLRNLPDDWLKHLQPDASLASEGHWKDALKRTASAQVAEVLLPIIELLNKGSDDALAIGDELLPPKAFDIWKRALEDGPAQALDQTIPSIKIRDEHNPLLHPCFMSAENLASAPRPYVRLIGMTSHNWPRYDSEDALIPDHVILAEQLNTLPLDKLDEADFQTITRTASTLTLSWPRRDGDGRRCEPSGILPGEVVKGSEELGRSRMAEYAMSEGDRLFCRPDEFARRDDAKRAQSVIFDWYAPEWTPHDGLVSIDHPRIVATLAKVQSATSLKRMMRDPLAFVMQYALGFRAPEYEDEPLLMDARQFGNLLHSILQGTVTDLEARGGFMAVTRSDLEKAIRVNRVRVSHETAISQPVPPELIWQQTLDKAERMAVAALTYPFDPLPGQISYCEVSFGNEARNLKGGVPMFSKTDVFIPGTDVKVECFIDRLDLSGDGKHGRVVDYKTGKAPKDLKGLGLNGGQELQRPIYLSAVRSVIDSVETVEAGLLFPATGQYAAAENVDVLLEKVSHYVTHAVEYLNKGFAVPGTGAGDSFNQYLFALPANAAATYLPRTSLPIAKHMPELLNLWSEE